MNDETVKLAPVVEQGYHYYLSTACMHAVGRNGEDLHEYCRSNVGTDGEQVWDKAPASCKFCGAPCICVCHA
jgi:hypothetical protein